MNTAGKLGVGAFVVAAATAYMAYVGAAGSWEYYLTVDECAAVREGKGDRHLLCEAPSGPFRQKVPVTFSRPDRLRVSGSVAPGSLRIASGRQQARFILQGEEAEVEVLGSGPLPDNLAEGIDVVVQGRFDSSGRLRADKILTRCAGKYESRDSELPSQGAPSTVARQKP